MIAQVPGNMSWKYLRTMLVLSIFAPAAVPAYAKLSMEVQGNIRTFSSDGIPDHPTGQFPGPGNPNSVSPQQYNFKVPAHPAVAPTTTALTMSPFGIALNGVLFDPFAAEWWRNDRASGWQEEPMSPNANSLGIDHHHAHVQPTGAYHYHGIPIGLMQNRQTTTGPVHLGYAADGFPIYAPYGFFSDKGTSLTLKSSYVIKKGNRPAGSAGPGGPYTGLYIQDYVYKAAHGDLDECNGRHGATPEFPGGTYFYVLTDSFPFIPRYYRGTPDNSFIRTPRPGGPGGPQQNGPGGNGGGRGRPPTNGPDSPESFHQHPGRPPHHSPQRPPHPPPHPARRPL